MENEKTYEDYYDAFVERDDKTNPFQISTVVSKVNTKMYVGITRAAQVFAGLRTGTSLLIVSLAEYSKILPPWGAWILAIISAIAGVWSIEGLLWGYGYDRDRNLNPVGIEGWLQKYAALTSVLIGAMISVLAGWKFGINFIDGSSSANVDKWLSFTTAIGFTFILFGVTDFVGHLRWLKENKPEIEKLAYYKGRQARWEASTLYTIATGEEQIAAHIAEFDKKHSTRGRTKLWQNRNASDIPQAQYTQPKHSEPATRTKSSPKYTAAMEFIRSGIDAGAFTLATVSPSAIAKLVRDDPANGIDECSPATASQARDDLEQIMKMENL